VSGIQRKCFEIDTGGRLGVVEYADVLARWRAGKGPFWIDVASPNPATRVKLLTELGLDRDLVDQLLDMKTEALSARLDDDSETVTHEAIVELKREIVDLDSISAERESVMAALKSAKPPFFESTRCADRFRVALGNTAATSRRVDRRADDLQSRYDTVQQQKTNRRLSRLTIISAIFLPLTLIAGLYGMNFDIIPGVNHPLGYPLTLAGMSLIALGLLWWFRSRGWMD
jgi:magnesium transporter